MYGSVMNLLRSLLCSMLGLVGYWALEWRERLEGDEIKAGLTD